MKNYVIGFVSFFDNEVKLEKVQATSEVETLKACSFIGGYEFPENVDVDAIQETMWNCDASISVIEI